MDNFFEEAYNEMLNAPEGESLEGETTQDVSAETPDAKPGTDVPTDVPTEEPTVVSPTEEPQQAPTGMVTIPEVGEFSIDEIKSWREHFEKREETPVRPQQPIQPMQYENLSPVEQRLMELEQRLADRELEDTLTKLKAKYADFDEQKVLRTAYDKGITDLEMVYKSMREETPVDVEALKRQLRAEIMAELDNNKAETNTLIQTGNAPVQASQVQLTQSELALAEAFGLTPEEYNEYR